MKILYGGRKLDPGGIHPSLLQTLQKIDEEDGKDNQFFSHKPKSFSGRSSTCEHKEELDQKSDSCESKMDNGGQKGSPIPAPITHQNHVSIDPNQVEFLKSFYRKVCMDLGKEHPSLLQILQELEKEEPCKNCFFDNKTSPDQNVRKDSSESSCMKGDRDSISKQGDHREMVSIEEERYGNVSTHHCENLQTKEKVFNHPDPNEKEKEISKS